MSTGTFTTAQHIPFFRFAWKEARALRAFWLAMFGLTIAVQCLSYFLAAPGDDLPYWLFCTSLGAAALFAVGASAIQFSIEHEDETHRFLGGLPMTWQPLFFGKLVVALVSSIALALVLVLVGWAIGRSLPSREMALGAVAFLGFGIVEGIAWGSFFSLRFKAPLAAAMLAIATTPIATQTVVALTQQGPASLTNLASYEAALPWRLLLVAGIFALNTLAARHWLTGGNVLTLPWRKTTAKHHNAVIHDALSETTAPQSISRKSVHTRLFWQTWREAGWLLGLPLLVAFAFYGTSLLISGIAISLFRNVFQFSFVFAIVFTLLIPGLYGALVFYIDQHRHKVRFLCQHGVSARHVWLVRHSMWFSAMAVAVATVAISILSTVAIFTYWKIQDRQSWLGRDEINREFFESLQFDVMLALQNSGVAIFAMLTAYTLGQCCSMAIRSGLLASFVTIVLSTVLSVWIAVTFAWQLSAWLFVLPIAIGLLLATWFRAPDWIAERNAPARWLKPAAAIALPLLVMALMLPFARLSQIPQKQAMQAASLVKQSLHEFQAGDTTLARETAQMYREAVQMLSKPLENSPVDKWRTPDNASYGLGDENEFGGIDSRTVPKEEFDEFLQAVEVEKKLWMEKKEAAIELAHQASLRVTCRFDTNGLDVSFTTAMALVRKLLEPRESVDNLLTLLRCVQHDRSNQTVEVRTGILNWEQKAIAAIAEWASREETTKDQIIEALVGLKRIKLMSIERPEEGFLVDHLVMRRVIEERTMPLVLAEKYVSPLHHLYYLTNKLPWERQRALQVLDMITARNIEMTKVLRGAIFQPRLIGRRLPVTRERLLALIDGPVGIPTGLHHEINRPLWSSHFAMAEYKARVPTQNYFRRLVDIETCHRACRLQLALEAYRRDHNRYPSKLAELAPEYLDAVPGDPWSGEDFRWEPVGLDLPLRDKTQSADSEIAPETPLLWSAGYRGFKLTLQQSHIWDVPEPESMQSENDKARKIEARAFYAMTDTNGRWLYHNRLLFPLTKPAEPE